MSYYLHLLRVYIETLELHSQSSRSFNSSHCKAYSNDSCLSIWSTETYVWIALILVDPPIRDEYLPNGDQDTSTNYVEFYPNHFWEAMRIFSTRRPSSLTRILHPVPSVRASFKISYITWPKTRHHA
ncbi:uncharacterized protein K441DRAFT_316964 [Cenococcum geophilum 1.58]|uniref:uncharacterized protein n=1 Tax=Cenococcum geophilum 1.58 TaxID=794803 RepID=UPI00358F54B3|nr:hypothetical protein K441DRAFT_316964 [Cenococcum geophilum 1.58]